MNAGKIAKEIFSDDLMRKKVSGVTRRVVKF